MKNKIAIAVTIVCVIALSACTSKPNPDINQSNNTPVQPQAANGAVKSSASPVASFPATSDADVKAIDKYFDDSKSTDFDDKALDELDK